MRLLAWFLSIDGRVRLASCKALETFHKNGFAWFQTMKAAQTAAGVCHATHRCAVER